MNRARRKLKVAAAQLAGLPLDQAGQSLSAIEQAIAEAAGAGADLLVLPECAYPAYCLGSIDNYRSSGVMHSQDFVRHLSRLASQHKINLVCGFVEDCGTHAHNSAVVIDAAGTECGRHRKTFRWGDDNTLFQAGDSITPIDTPVGRIGVVICAEGRAPEIATGLVSQGAQILALPTCWVNVAEQPGQFRNPQAEFMIRGRALECGVPIVAANKFGRETEGVAYCGLSAIVDSDARMLFQAPPDAPALINATVSLPEPQRIDVPDWARRRIFGDYSPITPDADKLDSVRLAVVPARMVAAVQGDDVFEQLAGQGVRVVATSFVTEDLAERMEVYGRALGMSVIGYPFVERLMIETFGAYGCVGREGIESFVPARVMALDGAAIIFVTGDGIPLPLLQTRAAENRVFLAAAGTTSAVLIDPAGQIIDSCSDGEPRAVVADIDLKQSADKLVYRETHVWQQRRPAGYAAAFGAKARYSEPLRA